MIFGRIALALSIVGCILGLVSGVGVVITLIALVLAGVSSFFSPNLKIAISVFIIATSALFLSVLFESDQDTMQIAIYLLLFYVLFFGAVILGQIYKSRRKK